MQMAHPRCLIVSLLCLFLGLSALPAHAVINQKSPKYAALMMDANTGEVFYARNADARRYPASLTKMMTLYLTFEALANGKIKLTDQMPVSAHAAAQPQTNISLRKGQTIPVEAAIKNLVVRSANDAAVVIAEYIGGTQWDFALMMTAKARELGMKNTVFRNPHGLPDTKQFTTARDMATLGIALRRDYPQFYPYFKTEVSTWNGVRYGSHNRVMLRYQGVDGIKTGYINMSGFNVVSSIQRDGHSIIGVVMGGQTGSDRDQHMMALLDKTFETIAERGDQPSMIATDAPVPAAKPDWSAQETKPKLFTLKDAPKTAEIQVAEARTSAPQPQAVQRRMMNATSFTAGDQALVASANASVERKQVVAAPRQETGKGDSWFNLSFKDKPSSNTLEYQLASLGETPALGGKWGIQVGAFANKDAALEAAARAVQVARDQLQHSQISVQGGVGGASSIHRARLANLSEYQAKSACKALVAGGSQCFVYRVDGSI